jgi:hypothetical protein
VGQLFGESVRDAARSRYSPSHVLQAFGHCCSSIAKSIVSLTATHDLTGEPGATSVRAPRP